MKTDAFDQQTAARAGRTPDVSVVVVMYSMLREAPRTLQSLSADYQRHVCADDYEVIVVDNGSDPPLDEKSMEHLPGNFRLIRIDPAPTSPARAINRGIAEARGEIIGVMIDGARIVTPGLLHFARHGARLYAKTVVATLGWFLGHDFQRFAIQAGYDQTREDALLAAIGWPHDGYRLFEVSTLDGSSIDGWLQPISESNALFLGRAMWAELGGVDERFDYAGGGFLNLDTYRRAIELPRAELVILLGEGTFHQLHGGIATNAPIESFQDRLSGWAAQYATIRGHPFERPKPKNPLTYLGTLPRPVLARLTRAAIDPVPNLAEPPLGREFDRGLWSFTCPAQPTDPTIAALVNLAHNEFRARRYESTAAIARLIRQQAPDEPEPQRLLSLVGAWFSVSGLPAERRANYHLALGEAHRLLGESAAAIREYRSALEFDPDLLPAQSALALLWSGNGEQNSS